MGKKGIKDISIEGNKVVTVDGSRGRLVWLLVQPPRLAEGKSRSELTASSLAEIGAHAGLLEADEQQNRLRVGKARTRRCPTDGDHLFDGGHFKVVRDTRVSTSGNGHDVSFYRIYTGGKRSELN
jgi:hypothetical protein